MAVVLLGLSAGCGGASPYDAALARGHAELACSRERLVAIDLGAGGVRVSGCGQARSYTCVARRGGTVCQPDGPITGTRIVDSASVAESAVWGTRVVAINGDAEGDASAAREALAICPEPSGAAYVTIVIGVSGDVLRLDVQGDDDGCFERALRAAHFLERGEAESIVIDISAPIAPSLSAATPTPSGDAAARAAVNGLRDAILSCTSGAPVAVVAEWTAAGALTIHLPADRVGSPEDGCVRACASGIVLTPVPGTSGSVLHPVH